MVTVTSSLLRRYFTVSSQLLHRYFAVTSPLLHRYLIIKRALKPSQNFIRCDSEAIIRTSGDPFGSQLWFSRILLV